MKEKKTRNGLRLLLTFGKINSIESALKVLEPLDFRVKEEKVEAP